jgi:putative PIN family toxin of toxin-antitoxin system
MRRAVGRVVLDTNVYVSAYGFGGKPADLLRRAIVGEFELVTSPSILLETTDKLARVLAFDVEHIERVVRQLAQIALVVRPNDRIAVLDDDPDNRVLEAAVEGQAGTIVSGDHHLKDLGTYRGIQILTVSDFLEELTA